MSAETHKHAFRTIGCYDTINYRCFHACNTHTTRLHMVWLNKTKFQLVSYDSFSLNFYSQILFEKENIRIRRILQVNLFLLAPIYLNSYN